MNDLRTRLTLDGSDFNTGMDESTKKVEDFQKKSGKAAESVKDLGKNAKVSTKELLSEMGKISGAERSMTGYQRKLTQIQKDIQDLMVNYRAMNAEMRNSEIGRQAAQRIQELTQEAANYRDTIMDARASIQKLASDTASWDAAKQGINALSAGLQGVVSAGILGKKSTEELVTVLTKLKGIEAATNSIITIGNALQRESALMLGIVKVQTLALAKAKAIETTATKGATIAQKAFNLVAKANPYVLLASAVIAVGTALFAFTKRTKEATKAQEAYNESLDKAKDEAAQNVAKFTVLERQYKSLKSEADKVKWINDNTNAFKELGYKIDDVNTADDVFINHAKDVIRAMELRAQAAAILSVYQEKYAEAYKKSLEVEQKKNNQRGSQWTKKDWDAAGLKPGEDYVNNPITMQSSAGATIMNNYQLTESGRKKMEEYGKQCGEAVREGAKESMQGMLDDMIDLQAEADKLDAKWRIKDEPKPTGTKPETPYVNQLDILKKQKSELEEQKKYLTFGSDEWKKQLAIIQEVEKEIKRLEEAEQGYLARLKNTELGPIQKIDSSKFQGRAEERTKTNEEKVVDYENAVKIGNKYKEQFELGLIDENTYKKFIDNLNRGLAAEGIKAKIGVDIEVKDEDIVSIGDKFKGVVEKMDTVGGVARGVVGSINNVYEAFKNLEDTLNDAENGWEQFFAIFQTGITLFESATTIIEAIGTVMEILNTVRGKGIQKTQQDTQATTQNIIAKQAEAGANITAGATAGIAAGGEAASSVASIPFVGPILAVAAIATVAAAIISLISSLKGFASGGIVGGNSYNGDKVLARLNSGEMVLNQDQQNNLWRMINTGDTGSSVFDGNVEFTIKGENLVGCLNNYNRKYNRI